MEILPVSRGLGAERFGVRELAPALAQEACFRAFSRQQAGADHSGSFAAALQSAFGAVSDR